MPLSIYSFIQTFAVALYILAITYAAFFFMVSGGNEQKVKKGKQIILYSTGLFVLVVAVIPVLVNIFRAWVGI